jgi:PPOX class probable FMN-dependent enzyme
MLGAMAAITTLEALRERYVRPNERARRKVLDHLDEHCRRFVELSPFAVVATAGADGLADATPRGGDPGWVHVADERTLLVPDRPGNNRLDTLENLIARPGLGLVFLVPGVDETLRVNGVGEIRDDEELLDRFAVGARRPATVLRVEVREAYLHCAKALMRSRLWDPEAAIERSRLPTLGAMLRDQLGQDVIAVETQDEMVARYRTQLY